MSLDISVVTDGSSIYSQYSVWVTVRTTTACIVGWYHWTDCVREGIVIAKRQRVRVQMLMAWRDCSVNVRMRMGEDIKERMNE